MKREPSNDRELLALFTEAGEGTLDATRVAALETRLLGDPKARRDYLRFRQLQGLLETVPLEIGETEVEEAVAGGKLLRFSRSRRAGWFAAAAAVAVACVIGLLGWLKPSTEPRVDTVATLILAEDCEWEGAGRGLVEGQRLATQSLRLQAGTAVIRFDGGAEMVLSGRAGVGLLTAGSCRIDHGEVVVRAEEGAEGFRVRTPAGEVIDLGTEFAVRVDDSGGTELHVHEGVVASGDTVVTAGKALKWAGGGREGGGEETTLHAPRFRELIRRANPRERRDLMRVYEGFHIDDGVYAPGEMDTGKGWDGSWRIRRPEERGQHAPDTSSDMVIDHGEMEIAWPVKGGRLGMLEFPAGRNIRLRAMAEPIDLGEDGITYFSFLAAESEQVFEPDPGRPAHAGPGEAWKRRHDFRLTFRSSEDYFGESLSFGWSRERRPWVQAGFDRSHQSIRQLPAGETAFLVGKILHSRREPDQVFFRFYRGEDRLDFAEPAEWDIEARDLELDASLDLLLLTAEGRTVRYVDEIRIGPTWRSVTPISEGLPDS